MTNHSDTPEIPRDIDSLVAWLPDPVRQALADLEGAPPEAAEITLGLLPFGRRALLEAVGVTRTASIESDEDEADRPRQKVTLTEWGHRVITAAADAQQAEGGLDKEHEERRTGEVRARLKTVQ